MLQSTPLEMFDFSSSDEDSGGLVMGDEYRGSSFDSSLPTILSFNNFQNRQNKRKESKDTIGESPEVSTNDNLGNPTKASGIMRIPSSVSSRQIKTLKTLKSPKASKLSKASMQVVQEQQKTSTKLSKPLSASPKSTKLLKSPKKIKAEPKGCLKLRLSIGGTTPSIEPGGPVDISSIIDFVASGGGGADEAGGVSGENQQFLPQQPRSKKSRVSASKGQNVFPDDHHEVLSKKTKKKKSLLISDSQNVTQAAAAARAAALADQVIASVAAEVEVEGSMSEDEDADPLMADPHRLTMVIPGENQEDIDAITESPQHEHDAIQGMLSMSGTFPFAANVGAAERAEARRSRTTGSIERLKARLAAKRGLLPGTAGQAKGTGGVMGHQQDEEDEFEKALRNCRQDDDFIYLGIDANDDDWKSMKKRNNRGTGGRMSTAGGDQTWTPKGVSLKGISREEQRPQRENVKREIMESTLAESTKYDPTETLNPEAKTVKTAKVKAASREKKDQPKLKAEKESITKISIESKTRRPGKKGMATAKQRLGKILKIHKMYH